MITKKITDVQIFSNGDLGTIIQVQDDEIGQTDVGTLKQDITNSVVSELMDSGGVSLNLINMKGTVPTYADLLLLTDLELNDAYQVEADGLVYVYTENGFQSDGDGFKVQADAIGVVEEGSTAPVSGGVVFDYVNEELSEKFKANLEIGAIDSITGGNVISTTRARNIGYLTGDKVSLTSTNLFLFRIHYYNALDVIISYSNTGLVKNYTLNYPVDAVKYRVTLAKNPNTDTIVQSDVDNSGLIYGVGEKYDFQSIDTFKPIKSDYDDARLDYNTSVNELGGIVTITGENEDNNIRIRSKSKISVLQQGYIIENITPGYVLSRIFRYKDGVFLNRVNYPPNTFTPDSTYNEVRFVWEKTNNTEIITIDELNDFDFDLFKVSDDTEKITEIAKRVSDIPNIENRLSLLESQDNPFLGKKVSFLGDSITTFSGYITGSNPTYYPAGDVTTVDKTWWMNLINRTGMILDTNNSYSGSTMAGTAAQSFCSRVSNIGNPDICFIFGGANDYRQNIPIGDFNYDNTTFDRTQFKQALQYILYNALNNNPLTRFIFILPTNRNDQGTERVNGFPINYNQEKYLAPYQEAIIEACNTYGVEYIDTRGLWSYYNVGSFTIDALHPNSLGMVKFEDYIYKKI